jgi:hydroxylamine reductase (hybrid-cluster protein)
MLSLFAILALVSMVSTAQLSNYEEVGKQFVNQWYALYDDADKRSQLSNFYYDTDTTVNFENQHFVGKAKIVDHFNSAVGNRKVHHTVNSIQVQPNQHDGVVVLVTGHQKWDNGAPRAFNQVFVVKHESNGVKIQNNLFKYRD